MKVELIDGAGNAIAWVQGGFGVAAGVGSSGAAFSQPKIDSIMNTAKHTTHILR